MRTSLNPQYPVPRFILEDLGINMKEFCEKYDINQSTLSNLTKQTSVNKLRVGLIKALADAAGFSPGDVIGILDIYEKEALKK